MTVEKLRQWLETMVEVNCLVYGDEYAEKAHTGKGVLLVPSDIRMHLIRVNVIQCTDDKGCLFYFTGKYGQTVIEVAPQYRKPREHRRIPQSEDRHREMCYRLAKMLNETTADAFEDMQPELIQKYIKMPYSSLIRPLLLADHAKGVTCSQLATRYAIPYHTVYTWINGK
jgi:hypothetical protein